MSLDAVRCNGVTGWDMLCTRFGVTGGEVLRTRFAGADGVNSRASRDWAAIVPYGSGVPGDTVLSCIGLGDSIGSLATGSSL